jgi:uncharacterized protein (DUF305 family)
MKSFQSVVKAAFATAVLASLWGSAAHAQEEPVTAGAKMDHSKMGDMKGMHMSMTGDADYDFASMMRQHHQMGLHMAQEELKNGKNAEMKQMAQKVIDGQTQELAALDAWLAKHKPAAATK